MDRKALQTYGTQQVMTSSPVTLVALLYDKAIVSLREAIKAIEDGKVECRWKANKRAIEIITHLANTLDEETGGEIAKNLARLYEFMLTRLFEVDRANDAKSAQDVIMLLEPLRESWRQLAETGPGVREAGVATTKKPANNENTAATAERLTPSGETAAALAVNLSA